MLNLFVLILCVIPFIMLWFAMQGENVIVYNGVAYPVEYDYKNGRISCPLFGAVKRYIRNDNKYNVFGILVSVQ